MPEFIVLEYSKICSRFGKELCTPKPKHVSAPAAEANLNASIGSKPKSIPLANVPQKASPEPVGSTASTGFVGI